MQRWLSLTALLAIPFVAVAAATAEARVNIQVDLTAQTMHVDSSSGSYDWPISSARSGYRTPRGSFRVQRMEAMHRSHKYYNSPMPHSLFFSGGYAIHGSYETGALGRPASHGCVRLSPGNAAALYRMVAAEGAHISITGSPPVSDNLYAGRAERLHAAARHRDRTYAAARRRAPAGLEDDDGYGYGYRYDDGTGRALGYAPVRTPNMRHWLENPADNDE